MDLERLFSIASGLALPGWLLLMVVPSRRWTTELIVPFVIPLVLALMYLYLMATGLGQVQGDFQSLAGVRGLFTSDRLLLAGWIHYLAFDLFIGAWEVRDARRIGVPHLVVVPCLFFTFLAGPVGLALYFAMRASTRRELWIDDGIARPAEASPTR
jgi:hypothetical protein